MKLSALFVLIATVNALATAKISSDEIKGDDKEPAGYKAGVKTRLAKPFAAKTYS